MNIVEYFGHIGRESADSYHERPLYRSWWFAIPLALCAIDLSYELWILAGYWIHLTGDSRFWLLFLVAMTTFPLVIAFGQHRAVRGANVGGNLARGLSITTVVIVFQSYFVLGIALHLILQFVKHGCP